METENELNSDILRITMIIRKDFPELSKYLNEMPVTIPNKRHPEIDSKVLKEYYNSLDVLLKYYAVNHNPSGK